MEITITHKKLKKCANEYKKLRKEFGDKRAKKIKSRLDDMRAADSLEDLRHAPGRYHALTGDRQGQWACDLDHPYRLIFEPHEQPPPTDEQGTVLWVEIYGVEIVDIADYH
ncbi:MAG: type II toxin-antitoxin system RelE/ParE family toxin [Bacteroidia bacterium]